MSGHPDLPEGWAEHTITIRYPVDELEEARALYAKDPGYLDPEGYTISAYKLEARLRAAALEQIPAPQRQPKVGEVWRLKGNDDFTRPVRLVDDTHVYLGPSSDGHDPIVWTLAGFLRDWEFVSEGDVHVPLPDFGAATFDTIPGDRLLGRRPEG